MNDRRFQNAHCISLSKGSLIKIKQHHLQDLFGRLTAEAEAWLGRDDDVTFGFSIDLLDTLPGLLVELPGDKLVTFLK